MIQEFYDHLKSRRRLGVRIFYPHRGVFYPGGDTAWVQSCTVDRVLNKGRGMASANVPGDDEEPQV